MEEIVSIKISNCNCIKEANIKISKNMLNIKYGCNGTGKSTISKAIFTKSNDDEEGLKLLRPYGVDLDDDNNEPKIENLTFSKVRVFDESYVNSYLFNKDSFLDNSFKVFLRSDECDKLSSDIEKLLFDLQSVFQQKESIQKLRSFLPQYFHAIKYSDGEISKRGGVGEFLKGNGCGFEQYNELDKYKPFYEKRDMGSVSKWAKWRNDGIKQMNGCNCPFCTNILETEKIEKQNKTISKVFKNSALSTANAVLEYIKEAVNLKHIKSESVKILENYVGNSNKEDSLLAELQQLAIETEYLVTKIEKICVFRPMNVTKEQLINIDNNLDEMILDERQLTKFYNTTFILDLTKEIKSKIDNLKKNTGELKGLFIQHENKMEKLINTRREDINEFLLLAGFPYNFVLKPNGEKKSVSYLIPSQLSEENRIFEPEKHLSWGEKNAFSLVMFMFEAISDNADIIVLDDPITSFDKEKKFAVVRRLFDNQKSSFRDKTVVMFTHDLQPIIDYIYGRFFCKFGLTTSVNAKWIQNQKGIICEHDIDSSDMVNIVKLTKKIAKDDSYKMPVRIVNLRKYIELTRPNFSKIPIYEILSNLIHGRSSCLSNNGEPIETSIIEEGSEELKKYLGNRSYQEILYELQVEKLVEIINTSDMYNKIIAIRLLFESDRFDLLLKLRRIYPSASKYVNETNHIENDYIFQLDPFKYFTIPECYIKELEQFINAEMKELRVNLK